jgi:hypothetical protein
VCGGVGPEQYDTLYAGTVGGDADAQARSMQMVDQCLASNPAERPAWVLVSLLRLKQYARAIEEYAGHPTADDAGFAFRIWSPEGAPIRRLPQFPDAAERIGWVDTWEKYGAPDACTRTAPRQYRCQ